jgi:hypothetical protein
MPTLFIGGIGLLLPVSTSQLLVKIGRDRDSL